MQIPYSGTQLMSRVAKPRERREDWGEGFPGPQNVSSEAKKGTRRSLQTLRRGLFWETRARAEESCHGAPPASKGSLSPQRRPRRGDRGDASPQTAAPAAEPLPRVPAASFVGHWH